MTEGLLGPSVHTAEDNCGWSFWMKRSAYTNSLHIPPAEHQQVTQLTWKHDTGGRAMYVWATLTLLLLLLWAYERAAASGGRKQRKEGESRVQQKFQGQHRKINTLHATVCSDMHSLCHFSTYNKCHFLLFSPTDIVANVVNPTSFSQSFTVTLGSDKNQQLQRARLSQKLINDWRINSNGAS